jgi:hypothetical protein
MMIRARLFAAKPVPKIVNKGLSDNINLRGLIQNRTFSRYRLFIILFLECPTYVPTDFSLSFSNFSNRPKSMKSQIKLSQPNGQLKLLLILLMVMFTSGCAVYQPADPNNLCNIFGGEPDWYEAAVGAKKRWKTSIPGMMAIMYQESRFVGHARPKREWFLGFIPLFRKSSAFGYAQAQDPVWDEYTDDGHAFDVRDDFDDAINFIGWYMNGSTRSLGIKKSDIYSQYLAYHEGRGGFKRKTYNKKPWLKQVAGKVKRQSQRYQRQFNRCKGRLDDSISGWF